MKTQSINPYLLPAACLFLYSMVVSYPALSQPSIGAESRLPVDESPDVPRDKPGQDDVSKPGNAGSNVKKNAVKKAGAAAAAGVAAKKVTSTVKDRGTDDDPGISKGDPGPRSGELKP